MRFDALTAALLLSLAVATLSDAVADDKENAWPNHFLLEQIATKCGKFQWKIISDTKRNWPTNQQKLKSRPGFFQNRLIVAKSHIPHANQADFAHQFSDLIWATVKQKGLTKTSSSGSSYIVGDLKGNPGYVWSKTVTYARRKKSGHVTVQMTAERDLVTLIVMIMEAI